ncbi:MAG: PDZ domain-containing protein [Terriglobales bacterium]
MDYGKYFGYAGLAVSTSSAPEAGSTLGLDTDAIAAGGLRISGVAPDSPAARAGLRPGERIVSIADTPATSTELSQFLAAHPPASAVTLAVDGNGGRRGV